MQEGGDPIRGYTYGTAAVSASPVGLDELEKLRISAGFTAEDEQFLRLAGQALNGQTRRIVEQWRSGIIAGIPHLARHSRTPEGEAIPEYLAQSNLRFEQWILDTCLRRYDQDWLNYQHEIALRHTSLRKNQVDGVRSTAFVPFHDVVAFVAVMNETIRPYLASRGNTADEVEGMNRAWCKSMQMQIALWSRAYLDAARQSDEW